MSLCSDSFAYDGQVEKVEVDDNDEDNEDSGEDSNNGHDDNAGTTTADGDDYEEKKLSPDATTDLFEGPQLSLHSDPPSSNTSIRVAVGNDDEKEDNYTPFGSQENSMSLKPDIAQPPDSSIDDGPLSSSSEPLALPYIDRSTEPTESGNAAAPGL